SRRSNRKTLSRSRPHFSLVVRAFTKRRCFSRPILIVLLRFFHRFFRRQNPGKSSLVFHLAKEEILLGVKQRHRRTQQFCRIRRLHLLRLALDNQVERFAELDVRAEPRESRIVSLHQRLQSWPLSVARKYGFD